jgi:superfamily I DNA and RNA helicase
MAWMIREDQLDPDQREFVNVESKKWGNIWVKGFAGSGKSVLLVHSLMDILQKEPNSQVIVLVYVIAYPKSQNVQLFFVLNRHIILY